MAKNKQGKKSGGYGRSHNKIMAINYNAARVLGGTVRISQRGVPHVLVGGYSVCWFHTPKFFRVFWPYGEAAWAIGKQENRRFDTLKEVKKFIEENPLTPPAPPEPKKLRVRPRN